MITKKMYTWFLISVATLCSTSSVLFGAVFVVTNTNNQGPGSLRQSIENVNTLGGATNEIIVSLIDGKITVFLLSELPIITKQVTLDGFDQVSQQPIVIDGNDNATVGLHVFETDASNTLITNVVIQNIKNNATDGTAYGILLRNDANNCSITNCTIHNISCGVGEDTAAAGILAAKTVNTTGALVNNTIITVKSAENPIGGSGIAFGIRLDTDMNGNCSQNTVSDISSGNSNQESSLAIGITIAGIINGNCTENIITEIHSGSSSNNSSGGTTGISAFSITNGNCSNNTVTNISSGNAQIFTGSTIGINVVLIQNGNCNGNTVTDISSGDSETSFSGLIEGVRADLISGTCSNNTIQNLTSGSTNSLENTGSIIGISVGQSVGVTSHNRIENLQSGNTEGTSGAVIGMDIDSGSGRCSYNIIDTLTSGTGMTSGIVIGITFDNLIGNCTNNTIKNLISGEESNGGNRSVIGILISQLFSGNCLNNVVCNLTVGTLTATNPKSVIGINLNNVDSQVIACNQIYTLTGNRIGVGLVVNGQDSTIKLNSIYNIQAQERSVGFSGANINNLITHNNIFDIRSENGSGFGINFLKGSTGNDIITNSIFNIDTKAINIIDNGLQTDVLELTLNSIRCSAGNRISITGILIPQPTLADRTFLIQFFVSDSDTPEQIKTFIGEIEHEPSSETSFRASFVVQAPTNFGQFITATATALPLEGSGSGNNENINTSEVSNALFACETQGGVCSIAVCPTEPVPTPPAPCPLLSNCPGIDLL